MESKVKKRIVKHVVKEFTEDKIYVELDKVLDLKRPFVLASDKNDVTKFQLQYSVVEEDDFATNI